MHRRSEALKRSGLLIEADDIAYENRKREEHGAKVTIYSPEKTLADCFKFRNKIGMDAVLEALKLYRSRMKFDHKKLLEYARICRVEKIMRPYLEASL
jgi:hypothetical protein